MTPDVDTQQVDVAAIASKTHPGDDPDRGRDARREHREAAARTMCQMEAGRPEVDSGGAIRRFCGVATNPKSFNPALFAGRPWVKSEHQGAQAPGMRTYTCTWYHL